ncbi:MAG: ATP-dependent Clp protease protease subunit, partial [Flavobacteriales bacterium]
MDISKEFEKFAVKDQGVNPMYYDKIMGTMYPTNLTPNIIE